MNRVVHFEIQVNDPKRAMKFYKSVFGWSFLKWGNEAYWMTMTAKPGAKELGINGGLLPRPAKAPLKKAGANAFVCTVMVKSFDDIAKKIKKAGGHVAMKKYALPGMAWQGYFTDTEGNTFGVHQPDKKAQ